MERQWKRVRKERKMPLMLIGVVVGACIGLAVSLLMN
jgi:gas vesicle protein